jgi:hypothetical protein
MDATRFGLLASLFFVVAALAGCSTPAVGDPCLPEQVPATGFDSSEAYIESSSVQCETRVCLVYKLEGDPREGCTPATSVAPCEPDDKTKCPSQGAVCADKTAVEQRVYCSCRCDAGDTGFAECECPDGFSCTKILEQGGPGVRGSYCVRKGTEDKTM